MNGKEQASKPLQKDAQGRTKKQKQTSYMFPGDSLSLVLFLFLLQHQLDEELLQFLVAVVDAELFEAAGDSGRLEQQRISLRRHD